MKTRLLLFFLTIFTLSGITSTTAMVVKPIEKQGFTIKDFIDSSNKELEAKFGADFSFKEKLGLFILKKKLKKAIKENPELGKIDFSSIQKALGCSKIVLKSGDIIEANTVEITSTEVRYKRCGKPNGPDIIISINDILSVVTENGDVIFRNTGNKTYDSSSNKQDRISDDDLINEPLGIAAGTSGILGLILLILFFAGFSSFLVGTVTFLLLIAALILGWTSLSKIKRNPEKYKGRGLAITGIISGGIFVLIFLMLFTIFILVS